MYIIDVIPIAKGMGADTLSYFTSKEVTLGALVDVPLRSKTVEGIVVSVRRAEDAKADIKQAAFALRKIEKLSSSDFLSPEFMIAAGKAAEYYATSIGNVLDALIPDYVLKHAGKFKKETKIETGGTEAAEKKSATATSVPQLIKTAEIFAVQSDDDERYGIWKSLIRQEFARKGSIIIVTPSAEDAAEAYERIEKGIEGYAFLLHGGMTSKQIIATWNTIMAEKHPVAIVMTGAFLLLDRRDVTTIVIEKENARGYKIQRRPYLDIRQVVEFIASARGLKLYLSDILLRAETLHREAEGIINAASSFKFRSLSTAEDKLVDMRTYKNARGSFKILSDDVEALITRSKNESEHMIIFATRRGVAPATVCGDCQNIVTCNTCSAPVVLHKVRKPGEETSEKSFFLCHHCGERRSTEEYCKTCGSWKLGTVGIGIELVEEKIRDKFPDITIFKIDADSTPTEKKAREVIDAFREKPGSILLGTEMMLSYIHEKAENAAIISVDSLLALPDFRIQEKILYTIVRLRAMTHKMLIVQTRKPDEKIFEYALKGNLIDFYRLTLDERKKYNYPPFSTLVKLTLEGDRDAIVSDMARVQDLLAPRTVDVFPAFTHTVKGNHILHGVIRLPRTEWPDRELIPKLRSLPPSVTIKVDPDSLL